MREYVFKVEGEDSDRRLDMFLLESFNKEKLGLSRTFIQKLISEDKVSLGSPDKATHKGGIKPHLKVRIGDEVRVCIQDKEPSTLTAEDIPLEIIYEDDDLAVINKSPGLVVHPAPGNYEHTLVNALLHRLGGRLSDVNPQRPGIVHRLDKETSGLLVIAKNNTAHLSLAKQFAKHTIKRRYIALVKGKVELDEGIIEVPIGRHPYKRKNMSAGFGKNTKYAKTHYRTLKRTEDYSVLELTPFTGRTHQLRVHLAFLGHPVLGDTKYGKNNEFNRLALHAEYIGFTHPRTGDFMEFSCEAPPEFSKLWVHLK